MHTPLTNQQIVLSTCCHISWALVLANQTVPCVSLFIYRVHLITHHVLDIVTNHHIWCLGYADEIVIAIEGHWECQYPHMLWGGRVCHRKLAEFAIDSLLIEKWFHENGLSVNPNQAELLLVTHKRKYPTQPVTIFNNPITLQSSAKYLGIYFKKKLTGSHHVQTKADKALKTMWLCRRAVGNRWGLEPAQHLWILQSINHPFFLHGVLVWWESTTKTNSIKHHKNEQVITDFRHQCP